tara:strand:+ start:1434 stop:1871 length:438 start_codon:yes stop_codon:yes gene_type:complete
MGIETKYEYTYFTVIDTEQWRRGNEDIWGEDGFTWEKAIDFINHKLKKSDDISVNKYRVEYAGYEQDIDAWIRAHENHKERPVFVQFQDDQPIMRRGEGSMFVLYEIGYGEEQEDDLEYDYSIGGDGPDINEGSVDGLAGAGGRL